MTIKSFKIVSYDIKPGRALTTESGKYRFDALIRCHGADEDLLVVYFLQPGSPAPDNTYDTVKKTACIYVPEQLYGWYTDLLKHEQPVFAYCSTDHPEWNSLSTGNEQVGEAESVPDVHAWLHSHPAVSAAIVWETPEIILDYLHWSASMLSDLTQAFTAAWRHTESFPTDPLPNKKDLGDREPVQQILAFSDAWLMYIAYVAQSLAVEIGQRVTWSVTTLSANGLAQLFDSRKTFAWKIAEMGYQIDSIFGSVMPCSPQTAYSFLFPEKIAGSRFDTICRLLDWCRTYLIHFSGGWETMNMHDQWQYRGLPPVIRILKGTPQLSHRNWGIDHRTAGCWGTVGFLRCILRTVNIPVELVVNSHHAQPHFIEDDLYLSHGDDPYDLLTRAVPPMPISRILISSNQFNAWFGPSVSAKKNKKNIGRRTVELSLTYLPKYLLYSYCQDMTNGKTHANGEVFDIYHNVYTVAQLEAQNLWGKMDNKIAALGGCNNTYYG
jgi:hypothetical protein